MKKAWRYIVAFFVGLFFILEWILDLISTVSKVIHEAVKELATALEIKYNELKKVAGEPDSGKK